MPMLTDIDTSGSEIDQDRFQDISPAGISIPLRTLVQTSFTTRKVIQHPSSKYEDTPRCLGLACDGSYLACGYDSGRFEIRTTVGEWRVITSATARGNITCIRWHPTQPRIVFFSSSRGNVHIIQLSGPEGDFVEDLITFDGYITGIAIRENGSQLAVALHDDQTAEVFLVMRPLSARTRQRYPLPTRQHIEPHREGGPIPLLEIPLSVHFLDCYSILVVYSTQACIFCTTSPFDAVGYIPSAEGKSSMYVSYLYRNFFVTPRPRIYASISPNKLELAACNPAAVALDRYSISQKRHVDAHYVMGTDVAPVSRRLFGIDWLDNSTIVAGHNESFVTIILDTKRDGHPDRYRHIYYKLNGYQNHVTHTVCSGIVGENPIIIAVNGEGKDAKMYIIDVCYSRPGLNQTVGLLQPLAREVNVSELSRHLTAPHRATRRARAAADL